MQARVTSEGHLQISPDSALEEWWMRTLVINNLKPSIGGFTYMDGKPVSFLFVFKKEEVNADSGHGDNLLEQGESL